MKFPALRPTSGEMLHLDLLRFIAAVGIVVCHSLEFFFLPELRPVMMERFGSIALFVDLFFVISGFVIAYVYSDRVTTLRQFGQFMQRRVGRLVPLHWLTLALTMLAWLVVLRVGYVSQHVPSWRPECILDQALLLNPVIPCGKFRFNGVTWSIAAEMVMYCLFPLFAWMANRSRTILPVLAALILLLLTPYVLGHGWEALYPVFRAAPSFLIGMALFYFRDMLKRVPWAQELFLIFTGGLIVSMAVFTSYLLTMILVYLTAFAAAAADVQGTVDAAVRRFAPLGQMTYSIYMWHSLFILVFIVAIGDKLLHGRQPQLLLLASACYILLFSCSYLSFVFVETPARRWIDGLALFGPAGSGRQEGPQRQEGQ